MVEAVAKPERAEHAGDNGNRVGQAGALPLLIRQPLSPIHQGARDAAAFHQGSRQNEQGHRQKGKRLRREPGCRAPAAGGQARGRREHHSPGQECQRNAHAHHNQGKDQ